MSPLNLFSVAPLDLVDHTPLSGRLIPFATKTIDWLWPFQVDIQFAGENVSCLEYRQYVRGYIKEDGQVVFSKGTPSGDFEEDTATLADGTVVAYGHRAGVENDPYDEYLNPDRPTGSIYHSQDTPGMTGVQYHAYVDLEINLEFQGRVIDSSQNNKVVASKTWLIAHSDHYVQEP